MQATPGLFAQRFVEHGPVMVSMVWGSKADALPPEYAGFAGVDPGVITVAGFVPILYKAW